MYTCACYCNSSIYFFLISPPQLWVGIAIIVYSNALW